MLLLLHSLSWQTIFLETLAAPNKSCLEIFKRLILPKVLEIKILHSNQGQNWNITIIWKRFLVERNGLEFGIQGLAYISSTSYMKINKFGVGPYKYFRWDFWNFEFPIF